MLRRRFGIAIAALALAVPALAQETGGREVPGGTIAILGGGAATTSTAGPLLGGTILYDVNNRFALEGQAAWFRRGAGSDAFSVNGSVLVNLIPLGATAVPYAAVGGGLYRASFDLAHARLMGAIGAPFGPGDQFGPGTQFCPAEGVGYMRQPGARFANCTGEGAAGFWGIGEMPQFYARRMGMMAMPPSGAWGTRTFTDPAVSVGGGVRLDLSPSLEVRPDARALVVFDGSNRYTVGIFGVNIGFRF